MKNKSQIISAIDIVRAAQKKSISQKTAHIEGGPEIEQLLRSVWCAVLLKNDIDLNDDFFNIGGDSLSAVRLASSIRKTFGVEIDLNDIFNYREIYSQAELITKAKKNSIEIPLVKKSRRYPASNVQKRLWFLSQLPEASAAYMISGSFVVEGDLQLRIFKQALDRVSARHDAIRTFFLQDEDGNIFQSVKAIKGFHIPLLFIDLSKNGARKSEVERFCREVRLAPFDLSTGPFLRIGVIKTDAGRFQIVYAMHHIISDGWSINVLARDISIAYDDISGKRESSLPPLVLQYKDVASWRENNLGSGKLRVAEKYWLSKLSGTLPVLDLHSSKPRPASKTFNGTILRRRIDEQLLGKFRNICHNQSATLFTGLLSALYVLLYRISGQRDIIIGSPAAGRESAELENQIGPYFNLMALRQVLDAKENFSELLRRVKSAAYQSYEHQSYPFDRLVEQLNVVRDPSRSPVFDVIMTLHNNNQLFGIDSVGMENLIITPLETNDEDVSQVDLAFEFSEKDDTLALKITYNPDVFEESEGTAIGDYFISLLNNIATAPLLPISQLEYTSSEERQRLLFGINHGPSSPVPDVSIIHLLFERVRLSGDAIAVRHGNDELTFSDFWDKCQRMAMYLRFKGVEEGAIVGILMDRSIDMLIAIIGTLMARCAYLPLDTRHPVKRLAFIIADAQVTHVISDLANQKMLSGLDVDVVGVADSTVTFPTQRLPETVPSDIAYVIYTSGSTGQPKGVIVEHRSVVNFFRGITDLHVPHENQSMLSTTNITFDISVLELLWTLSQGIRIDLHHPDLAGLDRFMGSAPQVDFSLFFFSSYEPHSKNDKYKLLLDTVRVADENGFKAVWTPERHFHEFGGIFPNPSLIGSALAAVTKNLQIRSGSVVMPLHDPLRVAEEWSVVDNLSKGRAGISFASGWHPTDFVLSETSFQDRHAAMLEGIATVKALWSGKKIFRKNGLGATVDIGIFPRPVQTELPVWITSAGNTQTFVMAGVAGANILTHFLGQDIDTLKNNILAYRQALIENGFESSKGKVTLMVHTYVGESEEQIDKVVKEPFIQYLKTSSGLSKVLFEKAGITDDAITPEIRELVFQNAYKRYRNENSLIGTQESCEMMSRRLSAIGVDEIANLVDFGIDHDEVLKGVQRLAALASVFNGTTRRSGRTTMIQTTPSLLKGAIDDPGSTHFFRNLTRMFVGGDQLPYALADRVLEVAGSHIYNMYGPTEATVWATAWKVEKGKKISIGRPLSNIYLYILDDELKPVPPRLPGTIYIGGACLARGYLNQPELTAERFLNDPFRPGKRIYNTGDLGKWTGDGNVEFLGRADHQVKIRGVRIEPGEIERALIQHSNIKTAVVAEKIINGEKLLVAYLVPENELDTTTLRLWLSDHLPDYMIPSYFRVIDKIPLSDNGKVDRASLPNPIAVNVIPRSLPENPTEEALVNLWKTILGVSSLNTTDNFFELGGHSLRVIRLVSGIRQQFGIEIDFRVIFSNVTIKEQARYIQHAREIAVEQIPRIPVADRYLCGPSQQRFWILNQFSDNALSYIDSAAFTLSGVLDIDSLKESFQFLVERHESLRTVFFQQDDALYQRIIPVESYNFEPGFIDISKEADQKDSLKHLFSSEQQKAFDLVNGPMLRVLIVKTAPQEHALLIHMPHIVSDGWSIEVLIRDISNAYNSFSKGRQPSLKRLPIQYKDYAAWMHKKTSNADTITAEKYWLEQLSGDLPVLDLPSNKTRPIVQTHNGRRIISRIPEVHVQELRQLCREQGATLFMGLLALLKVLFFRYTRENDIIVGTPVANRDHKDLEDQIGLYLNTLVLRTNIEGDNTFLEVMEKEKSVLLQAYTHKSLQFDQLIRKLNPERNVSRSALFDVFVVLQNFREERIGLSGLSVSALSDIEINTSQFDLDFTFSEAAKDVTLVLTYNNDVYDEMSVNGLIDHLFRLMSVISRDRNLSIDDLDLIGENERRQLAEDFNRTYKDYPRDETIIDLFEKQVAKSPGSIAVQCAGTTLTYRQLNNRANALGLYLTSAGATREKVVSIILERTELMTQSILGVWKSGAAYLLIDIETPVDRINYMMQEAESDIVVIQDMKLRNQLSHNLKFIDPVTTEAEDPVPDPLMERRPTDLAFVIFTSGSTGRPKGIQIEHRSKINHLTALINELHLDHTSIIAQTAPPSFDIFLWQMITALLVGGKTIIYSKEIQLEVRDFIALLQSDRVSILQHVPSYLNSFIDVLSSGDTQFSSLKYLVACGEEIKISLVNKWFAATKGIPMVNAYGPAEASDDVTLYFMDRPPEMDRTPIGKPIQNSRIYIVDKNLKLCPIGVQGEIVIGGECLARGYLRSELTKERFVDSPFEMGTKLYLTGDVGKQLPGGDIIFTGRNDSQVKVRGHRIELGEVESALLSHPEIREAAVVAREYRDSDLKFLVACYESSPSEDTASVRDFLAEKLPSYMIPAFFVRFDRLPVTANGKIDKNALRKMDLVHAEPGESKNHPVTREQELLLGVWMDILKRNDIGIKDNFFELGGDSVQAIQISGRLYQRGYQLELKRVFEFGTVEGCAPHMTSLIRAAEQTGIVGEVRLSPIQKDFLRDATTDLQYFNMSVALKLFVSKPKLIRAALMKLINHHDQLRCVFSNDGEWKQTCNDPLEAPPEVVEYDLTGMTESEAIALEHEYANKLQSSIDIRRGRLYAFGIFKRKGETTLLIVIHHLLVDAVSWRILLEDFDNIYYALKRNEEKTLPLKTDSFSAWTTSLYKLSQEIATNEMKYWEDIIHGSSTIFGGKSQPYGNSFAKSDTAVFRLLNRETSLQLSSLAASVQGNVQDVLLTGLARALRHIYKVDEVLVDIESHGRRENVSDLNVSRTVGWFTSTFPFLLGRTGATGAYDEFEEIRDRRLRIPNLGTGFGIIRDVFPPSLQMYPKDILFNYLGERDQKNEVGKTFRVLPETLGREVGPSIDRKYLLLVDVLLGCDGLEVHINYNITAFERSEISILLDAWREQIIGLIADKRWPQPGTEELSPSQMRMWILSQFDVNKLSYNSNEYFELYGKVDHLKLEESFYKTICRHESLRTNFIVMDGSPRQRIRPVTDVSLNLHLEDITGATQQAEALASIVARETGTTFDLANDLLLRVVMVRLSQEHHVLLLSYHHIVSDRWSLEILISDVMNFYNGNNERLQNLSYQYRDYTRWINSKLNGDAALAYKKFWMSSLSGNLTYLELKADHSRAGKSDSGRVLDFVLSREQLIKIRGLKVKHNVSTHALIFAMYNIVLSMNSGQDDIVIGSAFGGRTLPETEDQIGLYLNTLPIRTRIDIADTFSNHLRKTRDVLLDCYENQLYPLERIVDDLQIKRERDATPLFEVGITWLNTISNLRSIPGLTFKPLKKEKVFVKHDLWLFGLENADTVNLAFHYNTSLFEERTIRKYVDALIRMISIVAANDQLTIRDLATATASPDIDHREFVQRIDEIF